MTANAARLRFMRIRKIVEGAKGDEKGSDKEANGDASVGSAKETNKDEGKGSSAGGSGKKRKMKQESG